MILRYQYAGRKRVYRSSGHEMVVGRPSPMPVDLDLSPDRLVSRFHARLFYDLGTWWIADLDSRHGTFVNGARVQDPTPLCPGDEIRLGATTMWIEFPSLETSPGPGVLRARLAMEETQPPARVSEDERLETLAGIVGIVASSREQQAILEGFLRETAHLFPSAERMTIALIEDREIVPRVFSPPPRSHLSFTLARRAIISQQALHWVRTRTNESATPLPDSLATTGEALYAPMVTARQAVGVVHLDTTDASITFGEHDLHLLSIVATTMGAALKATENTLETLPSVFVSYAHINGALVRRLAADLRRHQVRVWFDERLRTGEDWRRRLATAIDTMDAFILLVSRASLASEQVDWERDTATRMGKRIFPVLIEPTPLPEALRSVQYVALAQDYEQGVRHLVESLHEQRT